MDSATPLLTDQEDLALVIAQADHWVAVAFRGRGRYERIEAPTLAQARRVARWLYRGRPVGIYAVAHGVRGAATRARHIENWQPT